MGRMKELAMEQEYQQEQEDMQEMIMQQQVDEVADIVAKDSEMRDYFMKRVFSQL